MILKTLYLHNFRNFKKEIISFDPKINIIYGKNAQGKTTILEAIFLLSTGRSFITSNREDLIKDKEKYFYIEAEIIKDLVSQNIKIYFDGKSQKIQHNFSKIPFFSNLLGIMPSIIHLSSDIQLISGLPSIRRKFLNIHLAQRDPLYVHHLTRYYRALKQRNYLLKKKSLNTINIWEEEMSKSASYISFCRYKMIDILKKEVLKLIQFLSDKKEIIDIKYAPAFYFKKDIKETQITYLEQLKSNRKKDLIIKTTQFGIHRDDFLIYLNKKIAKNYASEGQKKSIVTSIKLSEYKILKQKINSPLIMCIDDINTHLDKKRLNNLNDLILNLDQLIITTPIYIDNIKAKIINIENAKVLEPNLI